MKLSPDFLGPLIVGMQAAYRRGENAMAHARSVLGGSQNTMDATLVAYDLQAGSYAARAVCDASVGSPFACDFAA